MMAGSFALAVMEAMTARMPPMRAISSALASLKASVASVCAAAPETVGLRTCAVSAPTMLAMVLGSARTTLSSPCAAAMADVAAMAFLKSW